MGYIGLPTACILAENGCKVIGIDIDTGIIEKLKSGEIHIKEPGLDKLTAKVIHEGTLKVQTYPEEADVFIIAVPTPFKKSLSLIPEPNIDYVMNVARSISKVIKKNDLLLLESTSPVGTTGKIYKEINKLTGLSENDFDICYCPERVIPGSTLYELIHNDRIVGGYTRKAAKRASVFYSSFCKGTILLSDSKTAEMAKLSENAFRDVNIAFANELSIVCDKKGINVNDLINLANRHPRVNILRPGCGVGGHCIAVDPWFIASDSPEITPLIQSARKVNSSKAEWVIEKISNSAKDLESLLSRKIKIGIFGLSFKPDIDDLRESPAMYITEKLISLHHSLIICEPNLSFHRDFELSKKESVIKNADLLVFLVAHTDFSSIDIGNKEVLDFCGVLNSK